MSMKRTPFFTVIVLIAHITRQNERLPSILLMRGHFQMIHLTIRKFYIPAVPVIFQTRQVGHTVRPRKETCLLKYIGDDKVRLISLLLILGEEIDIPLPPCRVLQPPTIDRHLLGKVNDGIRRNAVIPEMLFRVTQPRVPGILLNPQHQRSPHSPID